MIRFFSPLNLAILATLALVTVAGFLFVPAEIALPVHWGANGVADWHLPRNWALLQMPAAIAMIWAIFWLAQRFGRKGSPAAAAAVLNVAVPAITALLVLVQVLVVLIGLGLAVNVVQAVIAGVALLQIALGNVMPKSRPNAVAGIRIATTLKDPANWTATHRLAGTLTMLSGLALLVAALLLPAGSWLLFALLAAWLLPLGTAVLYSVLLARRRPA